MVIVGTMWWFYFDADHEHSLMGENTGTIWSHGHALIFAGGAAVGGGLAAWAEFLEGHGHEAAWIARLAVTGSLAVFLMGVWLVHERNVREGALLFLLPGLSLVLVLLAFVQAGVPIAAALTACALIASLNGPRRT